MGWKDDPVVVRAEQLGRNLCQNDPLVGDDHAYHQGTLGKISDIAADSATLGLAKPLISGVGQAIAALGGKNLMPSVAQQKVELAQKESDVGPLASTAASIAGYAAPGNVLGPIAAGMTGGPIAAGALEGAAAGGISGAANNPDSPLGSAESERSSAGFSAAQAGRSARA